MRRRSLLVLLMLVFVPAAGAWTWPVEGPVLQTFSFDRAHPYGAGQHRGIAIRGGEGEPVRAPASGVVTFAGTVPTNGKTITIETPSGLAVSLTHLGSIAVARNVSVDEGAAVGTVGASGTPEFDVPYVHLGVREAANDQGYLDPLAFLPVLAPPAATPAPAPPVAVPASSPILVAVGSPQVSPHVARRAASRAVQRSSAALLPAVSPVLQALHLWGPPQGASPSLAPRPLPLARPLSSPASVPPSHAVRVVPLALAALLGLAALAFVLVWLCRRRPPGTLVRLRAVGSADPGRLAA